MNRDPIEDYLAELRAGLRTAPARTAEIIAEAEDHLRESAAARRAGGVGEQAAQRAAVTAFGPVRQVIRGHRPPLSAYAAAAALPACLLLGGYLLLSALLGGILLLEEIVGSPGRSLASVAASQNSQSGQQAKAFILIGTPYSVQVTAIFGGCVLAGVLLLVGFAIVRRQRRRAGRVLVPLPRGLFPLVAAIGLLAFWIAGSRSASGYWLNETGLTGAHELALGSEGAAVLIGVGCAVWALASLARAGAPVAAYRRREAAGAGPSGGSVPAEAGGAQRTKPGHMERLISAPARLVPGDTEGPIAVPRRPAPGYAAAIGMKAGPLLGSYLLLAALLGGILAYLDATTSHDPWPDLGQVVALAVGCALAGALLVAGFVTVTRRRQRAGLALPALPRGLSLLISVAGLLALAVVEYWFFVGDVDGTLRASDGIADLLLGSQWAAVLMGTGFALRTVATLVRWAVDSRRGTRRGTPPNSADLAPA